MLSADQRAPCRLLETQVGKKNKAAVTRQAVVSGDDTGTGRSSLSPIKAIFYGAMKSIIKSSAGKPSATIQPFCMLHLEIHADSVHTLEAALAQSFLAETIAGEAALPPHRAAYECEPVLMTCLHAACIPHRPLS